LLNGWELRAVLQLHINIDSNIRFTAGGCARQNAGFVSNNEKHIIISGRQQHRSMKCRKLQAADMVTEKTKLKDKSFNLPFSFI